MVVQMEDTDTQTDRQTDRQIDHQIGRYNPIVNNGIPRWARAGGQRRKAATLRGSDTIKPSPTLTSPLPHRRRFN